MMPYTDEYVLPLLERAIAARNNSKTGNGGQTAVAKELGTSPSLVCQLQSKDYPDSSKGKWYRRIVELYGNETVQCPTLGVIPLIDCSDERDKPSGIAPSSEYVRQRQMCKKCERRKP